MTVAAPATSPIPAKVHALNLLREMVLIRRFEEKCAELYSRGKIRGFLHLYIGEEAVAVGALKSLEPNDALVTTYREHGHALIRGISPRSVMAEMFGKVTGCSRGRGGSMHLFDAHRRFLGGNAIVGGGLPLAVGMALASRMQQRPQVTACVFGDGAVAEGEFHESLNLAALWKLPVLFLCENNLYAMGTALERHQSMTDISRKGDAYDIPASFVDGMDILAVEEATRRAVEHVRSGRGPYLLEARTYRFRAHSMYDAELYRSKEEVEQWRQFDPITTFMQKLELWQLASQQELVTIEADIAREIDDAVRFAEESACEPAEDLSRDVYTPSRQSTSPLASESRPS